MNASQNFTTIQDHNYPPTYEEEQAVYAVIKEKKKKKKVKLMNKKKLEGVVKKIMVKKSQEKEKLKKAEQSKNPGFNKSYLSAGGKLEDYFGKGSQKKILERSFERNPKTKLSRFGDEKKSILKSKSKNYHNRTTEHSVDSHLKPPDEIIQELAPYSGIKKKTVLRSIEDDFSTVKF